MPWLQLTFEASSDQAQRLANALEESGAVSVSLEGADAEPIFEQAWEAVQPVWRRSRVRALFPTDTNIPETLQTASAWLGGETLPDHRIERLDDQDWVRAWMDRWQPMLFGERLWVVPSWLTPPDPTAVNLVVDPGMAFGTGTHATTAMCLEWLDRHPPIGIDVMDFGCGSGILAIAALKLGARTAIGIDTDPQALATSRENAERNGVLDCLLLRDPDAIPGDRDADLILANILAPTLIHLAPVLTGRLRPGGTLLLSGLLTEQAGEVELAYRPAFDIESGFRDGWALLTCRKRT